MGNLLTGLPDNVADEVVEVIATGQQIRIERIVSNGQSSPPGFWYDQEQHEWVLLLQGNASIQFADNSEIASLSPGDHLNIRAHRKHRVLSTSSTETTIWLAIHYC